MKRIQYWVGLVGITALMLGLAACGGQAPAAEAPTATPKPPVIATGQTGTAPTVAPAATASQPAAAAPTARPAAAPEQPAMSPQFATLNTVIAVQSAQAYIAGAGFHAIAEDLMQTKTIQPGYLGTVRNTIIVANTVPWPADLAREEQRFLADLKTLETALVSNQPADAVKAVDAVHESEHDLAQATFAWLGSQNTFNQADVFKTQDDATHLLGCIGVQSAQAYIAGAGFHAIAEDLMQTKTIQPDYLGTVRNTLIVANAVPWPTDLTQEQQRFVTDLKAFESALVANQPADAVKAVDAVHESEHDLAQATFTWLGEQKHDFDSIMGMMGGDKMMQGMLQGIMVTGVQSAQAYIAGAGFHEIAEQLDKTNTIQPEYLGTVRNVLTVVNTVPWPADLNTEQQKFVADLQGLEAVLVANKPADAAKAADAVHESEHDLTQASFAWLEGSKVR